MTTKYLEIDSTYRNRQRWPLSSHFGVEITRPTTGDDPISDSAPIIAWKGDSVNIAATVVSSTTTNIIITALGLPEAVNYETNAIFAPSESRIYSYTYLGANQAEIILLVPLVTALIPGNAVSITDPTDLVLLRLFVPGVRFIVPDNFFKNNLLYDETVGAFTEITSYRNGIITVANPIPGWATTDSFSIRTNPPSQTGTSGITSTPSTVVGVTSVTLGSFIRILPLYPSIAPSGEISKIASYNQTTSTVTVSPPFSASPAGLLFEILPFTDTNVGQLRYTGTTQTEHVNSTIRLLDLVIPNEQIESGYGGKPTDYPYFYVHLTPRDTSNIDVNCSNNPNSVNMLFRATYIHSTAAALLPFLKFDANNAAVRVRFKVDSDLTFRITLPNGEPLKFIQHDTVSPERPNPFLQISAMFEIVRDHGLGVVYSGAYG